MSFRVIKTTLIELPFTASDSLQKRYFPVQNFLRKKRIISVETYSVNDMPLSPITQSNVLPSTAQLMSATLSMYGDNPEMEYNPNDPNSSLNPAVWMDTIPLVSLHRLNNGADPFVFAIYEMHPRIIVWEKSFVELTAPLGDANPATSFVFLVGYLGNEGDN